MITKLQSTTLAAVFAAAAVAAGLALSLVPNVELVTLVVFCAGCVLGWSGGLWVGGVGMVLYVFANSALRGFSVSPLPLLAAQAAGMGLAGMGGAWWRRLWLSRGKPNRVVMWWLPVFGALLTLVYQILLNGVSTWLFSGGDGAGWAFFLSGMGFGMVQVVSNAVVFAVVGPSAVLMLRKLARQYGWWLAASSLWVLFAAAPDAAVAQIAVAPDSSKTNPPPTTTAGTSQPDSTAGTPHPDSTAAPDDSTAAVRNVRRREQPKVNAYPAVMYKNLGESKAGERSVPSYLAAAPLGASQSVGLVHSEDVYEMPERWGLGWGRTQFVYDGVPASGPVYAFAEPPHLSMEWLGNWYERWHAAGTQVWLAGPPDVIERPLSQFTLTTGSYGRRTAQFAIFRNLGSVNLGATLADFSRDRDFNTEDVDSGRFQVRLSSAGSSKWSVDFADGRRKVVSEANTEYAQNSRRLQGSWGFTGGTAVGRLSGQLRRDAAKMGGQGEIRFDGFTLQTEVLLPSALRVTGRFHGDRRRGGLSEQQSFYGGDLGFDYTASLGSTQIGAHAEFGHQNPVGATVSGQLSVYQPGRRFSWRGSLARESGIPPMVDFMDRPGPEVGLPDYLALLEANQEPEVVHAARGEVVWSPAKKHRLALGGWAARQENYRIASNPLWSTPLSPYAPLDASDQEVTVIGGYAEVLLGLPWHLSAFGAGRIHNRDRADIPYLPQWDCRGYLEWRRNLFKDSLDLSLQFGGKLWGDRLNPSEQEILLSGAAFFTAEARVDNGTLFLTFNNLASNAPASDFRLTEAGNLDPMAIPPQTWRVGLTLHLVD